MKLERMAMIDRKAEAKARRKINKDWTAIEGKRYYKQRAAKQVSMATTRMIQHECFDGIILQLDSKYDSKSFGVQKRILRRIVEKRQAQSIHKKTGRTHDKFFNQMVKTGTGKCIKDLDRARNCA